MIRGEFKKVLFEVFDALGFFEHEKQKALEGFKKKFASQLLIEIRSSFSDEQRKWVDNVVTTKSYNKGDPKVSEIQKTVDSAYPEEKMDQISRDVFKRILASYINFMSQRIEPEKTKELRDIVDKL